ncbi:hypothetical protein MalM25_20650 [Planctomycetes bacterium MalM25]|nr:hypothetical protein MalM25_20650 [Planctomycetes bacterium MalM25]
MAPPAGARRMDPEQPVWVDPDEGVVHVDGRVTLRQGVLEMFACPAGTKEHESIVGVDAAAELLHVALLAVGAEPGAPVQFHPEYVPPRGTVIEVRVHWQEGEEKRSADAQEWIRRTDTGAVMKLPFVFAGSRRWTDPESKKTHYAAQAGDLICVSNFTSAMLDVPVASTDANDGLLFEPFTERIPPVDTPVRLSLRPVDKSVDVESTPEEVALNEALATVRYAAVGAGVDEGLKASIELLAEPDPERLLPLLHAMQAARPLAENYLRMSIDTVADRTDPSAWPLEGLRAFLADKSYSPRARRTAFELLGRVDAEEAETLLDGFLDDPSQELRYDAVAKRLRLAAEAPEAEQAVLLKETLRYARSLDQLEEIERRLEDLGSPIEFAGELGVVKHWLVVGPFDNRDGVGFEAEYAPEKSGEGEDAFDATVEFTGHDEEGPQGPFTWKPTSTEDRLGEVELNSAIGSHKGAVGYARAVLVAEEPCDIEIRYTSKVACKLWVNDWLHHETPIYHSGSPFDQHVVPARLEAGENVLLLKACQNQQSEPWAQTWSYQLRVTGPNGAPLRGVSQPTPQETP